MAGFLLHMGATVLCAHGGAAAPTAPNPRVRVMGQPVATQTTPYLITGCANPPDKGGPCVTAAWITAASRIKVMGQPVVLAGDHAICAPTGAPLQIIATQMRVKGM